MEVWEGVRERGRSEGLQGDGGVEEDEGEVEQEVEIWKRLGE